MKLTTKFVCLCLLLLGSVTHAPKADAAVNLMCYLAASRIDAYSNGAGYDYFSDYWYAYYYDHC